MPGRASPTAQRRAETAEALEGLSEAAHFEGDYAEAIALKERAFAAYRQRGEREAAARVARWLAFLHGAVQGNRAVANGWMARAGRLLDGLPESAEHGRLALDRVAWTADVDERERYARTALEIGRRVGDAGLEFSAQAVLGHAAVLRGRVDDGMALLDEALAAVAAGEVEAIDAIGQIYCRLLGACERTTDVRRAEQWMGTARDFTAWADFVGPTCRLHYGAILVAIGRWPEAEAELMAAARAFELGYRGMRPAALVRLAALRVRQGRLEDAELLLAGIEGHAAARVQRAAIALARGDLPLAEDLARLCLDAEDTSQPAAASLWELLIRVHVAATTWTGPTRALGGCRRSPRPAATSASRRVADLAAGRVLAARGDGQATRCPAARRRPLLLPRPAAAGGAGAARAREGHGTDRAGWRRRGGAARPRGLPADRRGPRRRRGGRAPALARRARCGRRRAGHSTA